MQITPAAFIPVLYMLISMPYLGLGFYAWSKRPGVALIPFTILMGAMAVWSFSYGVDILLHDLPRKLFLSSIEGVSYGLIPIFLPAFVLAYTGRSHLLTWRTWFLLSMLPAATILLVLTNSYHGLAFSDPVVVHASSLFFLTSSPSNLLNFFFFYSYLIIIVSSVLLILDMLRRPGFYRIQSILLVLGIFSPHIGGVFFFMELGPIPYLDTTPLFFIPTAFALYWAISRYQLLDVIPLAHTIVLQNIGDGVIVVDARQRMLYMNPTAEMILNLKESNVLGQPLGNLSSSGKMLTDLINGHETRNEISFDELANSPVFEVTHSPMYLLNRPRPARYPGNLILLHDITLRKETEGALHRREALLTALSQTAERFMKETHWELNIPQAIESIGQAADVSRVYVFVNYMDDDGILHTSQCYEWAAPGVAPQIDNPELQHLSYRRAGFSQMQELLSRGEPFQGPLKDLPASMRSHLAEQDIQSLAMMPIFVQREWWGFMGFDECRNARVWTDIELDALRTAASLFGDAESRSRSEIKLIERQHSLDIRNEIVQLSLETENLQAVSQKIVDSMVRLIAASDCFLDLWNAEEQRLVPLAASEGPYKESYSSYVAVPGIKPVTQVVAEQGHTIVVEDVKLSPYTSAITELHFPTSSLLALPLNAVGQQLGAILLTFDLPHRFTAEEIKVGEQAAGLAALVLARADAIERARRRAEESETLRKAGMAVAETLRAEEAVNRILEQLAQVISYDSASVQLLDGSELVIVGGRGWEDPAEVVGKRFPIPGDNPNTIVIQSGKPLLVHEAEKHYPEFGKPPHDHIHSWLGVPLIVRNQTVGLLAIDSSKPDHFTQENVQLAGAFGAQVAVALENARLYEKVENQAITDALTGIPNRRGLFQLGRSAYARCIRFGRPFAVIMLDIDHFKRVNDTYGHEVGDRVLQEIAARCIRCVRETDFIGRYGGEEFVLLLPETNGPQSIEVAERLRAAIGNDPMQVKPELGIRVTASLGVSCRDENTTDLESLIARADEGLYAAKKQGRNRVVANC